MERAEPRSRPHFPRWSDARVAPHAAAAGGREPAENRRGSHRPVPRAETSRAAAQSGVGAAGRRNRREGAVAPGPGVTRSSAGDGGSAEKSMASSQSPSGTIQNSSSGRNSMLPARTSRTPAGTRSRRYDGRRRGRRVCRTFCHRAGGRSYRPSPRRLTPHAAPFRVCTGRPAQPRCSGRGD